MIKDVMDVEAATKALLDRPKRRKGDDLPPIIKMIENAIVKAHAAGAVDIRFVCPLSQTAGGKRPNYRVEYNTGDGKHGWKRLETGSSHIWPSIKSRLKIMASMSIAEQRRSQHGLFDLKINGVYHTFRCVTILESRQQGESVYLSCRPNN